MKTGMLLMVVALVLGVGYLGLPGTSATYQDTKTGVINIRVSIPEEAPTVAIPMTPDSTPLAAEEVVSEQSSAPIPPPVVTTTELPPVPSVEPSTPEEPVTSSVPTEEKEPSSGPTVP